MVGHPITIKVLDLQVSDPTTDAALLQTWIDSLSIADPASAIEHLGWRVEIISNTFLRYTIVYEEE